MLDTKTSHDLVIGLVIQQARRVRLTGAVRVAHARLADSQAAVARQQEQLNATATTAA